MQTHVTDAEGDLTSHVTEIRDLSPTMLTSHAWRCLGLENWFELWREGAREVVSITMGYYKACSCGWADPTCHQTIEEASAAKLPCETIARDTR